MLFRKKCISERKVIEFYRRFRQRKACHLSTSVQFLILMAKRSVKLHLRTCSFKNNFFCSVQTCCRQKTLKNLNNLNCKPEFLPLNGAGYSFTSTRNFPLTKRDGTTLSKPIDRQNLWKRYDSAAIRKELFHFTAYLWTKTVNKRVETMRKSFESDKLQPKQKRNFFFWSTNGFENIA